MKKVRRTEGGEGEVEEERRAEAEEEAAVFFFFFSVRGRVLIERVIVTSHPHQNKNAKDLPRRSHCALNRRYSLTDRKSDEQQRR